MNNRAQEIVRLGDKMVWWSGARIGCLLGSVALFAVGGLGGLPSWAWWLGWPSLLAAIFCESRRRRYFNEWLHQMNQAATEGWWLGPEVDR